MHSHFLNKEFVIDKKKKTECATLRGNSTMIEASKSV